MPGSELLGREVGREHCEAQGLSRSEVVKRAIMDLAQAGRRGPFGRVARDLGIVGCFSGPRDLGERHGKHFRRALGIAELKIVTLARLRTA